MSIKLTEMTSEQLMEAVSEAKTHFAVAEPIIRMALRAGIKMFLQEKRKAEWELKTGKPASAIELPKKPRAKKGKK